MRRTGRRWRRRLRWWSPARRTEGGSRRASRRQLSCERARARAGAATAVAVAACATAAASAAAANKWTQRLDLATRVCTCNCVAKLPSATAAPRAHRTVNGRQRDGPAVCSEVVGTTVFIESVAIRLTGARLWSHGAPAEQGVQMVLWRIASGALGRVTRESPASRERVLPPGLQDGHAVPSVRAGSLQLP